MLGPESHTTISDSNLIALCGPSANWFLLLHEKLRGNQCPKASQRQSTWDWQQLCSIRMWCDVRGREVCSICLPQLTTLTSTFCFKNIFHLIKFWQFLSDVSGFNFFFKLNKREEQLSCETNTPHSEQRKTKVKSRAFDGENWSMLEKQFFLQAYYEYFYYVPRNNGMRFARLRRLPFSRLSVSIVDSAERKSVLFCCLDADGKWIAHRERKFS